MEIHLEAVIEWTLSCTSWLWSSEVGDTLGCHHRANMAVVIGRVRICTACLWLCELGGRDRASLEAVIKRVWRCSWRLSSSNIGGVLGGGLSGGDMSGTRPNGSWDSIYWVTRNCGNVEIWVQHGLPRDQTGWEWETVDHGMMQYAVYAVIGVNSWSWHGEIESDVLTSYS